MSAPILLGIVTGVKPDKRGETVAWVKPLFSVTEAWREIDPKEFPTRGYLFWDMAEEAVSESLVFVRAKENSAPLPNIKDEYRVTEPHPAFEVLDLRRVGGLEQVRTALSEGMRLPENPPRRVLIWCDGNNLVGPVSLAPNPRGKMLEKANRQRIPCFLIKQGDIRVVKYDGRVRHVFAKTTLGIPETFIDWDDDRSVVKRAVEFAANLARKSGGKIESTKQLVEQATGHLEADGSQGGNRLELYRLRRALPVLKDLLAAKEIAAEILDRLREDPKIKDELERAKTEERASARSEMEKVLKVEREQLAKLRVEREVAESALKQYEKAAQAQEIDALNRTKEIEQKIRRSVAEAIDSAPAILSQVALLKPFLERSGEMRRSPAQYSYPRWEIGPSTLSTIKDLRARMVMAFKGSSVATPNWQRIHAAFAARVFPIVSGPRAIEALSTYSMVAAAGRMTVVQVPTGLSEWTDLFGRLEPSTRSFTPHPARLIDITAAATASAGLLLVVLDGANRGATESYLLPLVRAALRRTFPLQLFHPGAIDGSDPYSRFGQIEWPRNLLLAATLVEGPTSLPLSPDLWADSVLIEAEESGVKSPSENTPKELFEIAPTSDLLLAQSAAEDHESEWLDDLVAFRGIRDVAMRFGHALRIVQNDPTLVQAEVTKAVIAPYLASMSDDTQRSKAIDEIKRVLGPKYVDTLTVSVNAAKRKLG